MRKLKNRSPIFSESVDLRHVESPVRKYIRQKPKQQGDETSFKHLRVHSGYDPNRISKRYNLPHIESQITQVKAEKHIYEIEKNLKQSREVAEKMTKKLEDVKKNLDFHQLIMTKKVEEDKKIEVIKTSQKQLLEEQAQTEREEN